MDPVEAILPFVAILDAFTMSGPFKMASLAAIQQFLSHDCLLLDNGGSPGKITEAIDMIVETVTKCKFIQTDATSDKLAKLQKRSI